jgi:DNA topoisomerase-1
MSTKCTVIITEKPDASKKIAEALSQGKLEKKEKREAFWYELTRDGKKYIVTCAVGHLFVLDTVKNRSGWTYPVFDVEWVPTYTKKGSEFVQKYFENIQEVVKNGDNFIVATDYDTEGSVIGYNVLKFLCNRDDAKRMKFSTLTKDEIIESFANASTHLDFGQVEAGLTRHYLDFYWGINLTRALTLAMKNVAQGGFTVLSTGRVQGPTLKILLDKELEIRKFKPTPFWQLELHVKMDGMEVIAIYEEDKIWKKEEADKILEECRDKDATVEDIKKREYKQPPPVPFNTTDLQAEAYAQFKFTPTQTMSIAESLYQAGIISYPRSSSQKLPPAINYEKILKALATLKPYGNFVNELLSKTRLVPNEGKREDPAHPAVYPTFEVADLKKLTAQQKKLYDLIVRRFLSIFADDAIRESMNVILDVNGHKFIAVGKRTIKTGWTKIYEPYLAYEEQVLPKLKIGQVLKILKLDQLAKETQPPGRYSQGSILKEMEERNLGTRATRAEILKTLYDRRYIIGQSIRVTKLGEVVTKALYEYAPRILSEELTRKFEEEMDQVFNGKKRKEEVIEEAKTTLVEILEDFKKKEKNIGKKLLEGLIESRKEERKVGACPNCKTGELRIIISKKTRKAFVGCSNYPNCKTAFPLPQFALIVPLGKLCETCHHPMIQVVRKGRRPFRMCINHKCSSKEGWGKRKISVSKFKAIRKNY